MVLIEILCAIFIHISKKQCVRINKTASNFEHILPGTPQGSTLGPTLFNLLFNDFFFCILIAPALYFADDYSLTSFAATVEDLIELLQYEYSVAIEWFIESRMFVNPDEFRFVLLDKKKSGYTKAKVALGKFKLIPHLRH